MKKYTATLFFGLLLLAISCQQRGIDGVPCESPQALLDNNEYVVEGIRITLDTLASLGHFHEEYNKYGAEYYLLEYGFWCNRAYKADPANMPDTVMFVWYIGMISDIGWRSGLSAIDNTIELVYGNAMTSSEDFPNLLRTQVSGSFDDFRAQLDKKPEPNSGWYTEKTILQRLLVDSSLGERLADSRRYGPVLYGTDWFYNTNERFHEGTVPFQDEPNGPYRTMTSYEYLEELDSLARLGEIPQPPVPKSLDDTVAIRQALEGVKLGTLNSESQGMLASKDQRIGTLTR